MSYWYQIYKDGFDSKWIIITNKKSINYLSYPTLTTKYYLLNSTCPRNYELFSIKIINPIIIGMLDHKINIECHFLFRDLVAKDLIFINIEEEYKNIKNYKI